MSKSLHDQLHLQEACAAAQASAPTVPQEQQPDPAAVGRAQRSEPERSDGERSGARPPKARPRHRACPTKVAQGFAPSSSDARPPFAFFACSAR